MVAVWFLFHSQWLWRYSLDRDKSFMSPFSLKILINPAVNWPLHWWTPPLWGMSSLRVTCTDVWVRVHRKGLLVFSRSCCCRGKKKKSYLKGLQPGLLLLQRLLLLLFIHAAEGHPGGGERGDGVGQSGRPARGTIKIQTISLLRFWRIFSKRFAPYAFFLFLLCKFLHHRINIGLLNHTRHWISTQQK